MEGRHFFWNQRKRGSCIYVLTNIKDTMNISEHPWIMFCCNFIGKFSSWNNFNDARWTSFSGSVRVPIIINLNSFFKHKEIGDKMYVTPRINKKWKMKCLENTRELYSNWIFPWHVELFNYLIFWCCLASHTIYLQKYLPVHRTCHKYSRNLPVTSLKIKFDDEINGDRAWK